MPLNSVRKKIGTSLVALECHFIITPKRKLYKIENIFFLSYFSSFSILAIIFVLNFRKGFLCPPVFGSLSYAHRIVRAEV